VTRVVIEATILLTGHIVLASPPVWEVDIFCIVELG
jgi:hypothetical protein